MSRLALQLLLLTLAATAGMKMGGVVGAVIEDDPVHWGAAGPDPGSIEARIDPRGERGCDWEAKGRDAVPPAVDWPPVRTTRGTRPFARVEHQRYPLPVLPSPVLQLN